MTFTLISLSIDNIPSFNIKIIRVSVENCSRDNDKFKNSISPFINLL